MNSKKESCRVSAYQKRKLAAKLDDALKQLNKARDVGAIVAAKTRFREVQEEIKKAYGE